jgi:thiol-disulfide isomerase/thioredoxin
MILTSLLTALAALPLGDPLAGSLPPASVPVACVPVAGDAWEADFDVALARAKEEGKHLLVDFTGSDWCGWCIRLDREVFAKDAFLEGVADDFVLVALDFPRGAAAQEEVPNPERNDQLRARHGVTSFPSVLLLTVEGDVLGRTGYRAGGPEAYVKHLRELKAAGEKLQAENAKLAAAVTEADDDTWRAAWDAVVKQLRTVGADAPGSRRLLEAVRVAFVRDPENALRVKAHAVLILLSLGVVDDAVYEASVQVDPENHAGLREHALHLLIDGVRDREQIDVLLPRIAAYHELGATFDEERAVYIHLLGAYWASKLKQDHELARTYAARGLEIGTKNPRYRQQLEQLAKR